MPDAVDSMSERARGPGADRRAPGAVRCRRARRPRLGARRGATDPAHPGRPGRPAPGRGVVPPHRPPRAGGAGAAGRRHPAGHPVRLVGPHGAARPRPGRPAGPASPEAARSPIDGVTMAIDDAVRAARQGDNAASPMDRWLAGLSPAGSGRRAGRRRDLGHPPVVCPRLERLRGAADHRAGPLVGQPALVPPRPPQPGRGAVRRPGSGRIPLSVHLVVLGGPRRATIRSELSVVAMVEVLCSPRSLPPGRIVGWWPDSGHLVTVEIDQLALHDGVAAVARTLASVGATPADSRGQSGLRHETRSDLAYRCSPHARTAMTSGMWPSWPTSTTARRRSSTPCCARPVRSAPTRR